MIKLYTFTVNNSSTLNEFLRGALPDVLAKNAEVSNSKVRRLIVAGAVTVNCKQCRVPAWNVLPGTKICVSLDEEKLFYEKKPDDIHFDVTDESVLYEDDVLIVVNKPA